MSQGTAQKLMLLIVMTVGQVHADSVDTTTFGNLSLGASMQSIEQKLGAPDRVVELPKRFVQVRTPRGGHALEERITVVWIYSGGGTLMDTYLTFVNGILTEKDKRR